MKIIETEFPDLLLIEPDVFRDSRGYFLESYSKRKFEQNNLSYNFVQDNESKSEINVIRGLHYQLAPYSQTKLIRVIQGRIIDVIVDIRKNSPTFGKWAGFEISEENMRQLLIPSGFAHGFSVLSETVIFQYKCDNFYNKESERGINFNDPGLNIEWGIDPEMAIVSAKDKVLPNLQDAEMNFIFQH